MSGSNGRRPADARSPRRIRAGPRHGCCSSRPACGTPRGCGPSSMPRPRRGDRPVTRSTASELDALAPDHQGVVARLRDDRRRPTRAGRARARGRTVRRTTHSSSSWTASRIPRTSARRAVRRGGGRRDAGHANPPAADVTPAADPRVGRRAAASAARPGGEHRARARAAAGRGLLGRGTRRRRRRTMCTTSHARRGASRSSSAARARACRASFASGATRWSAADAGARRLAERVRLARRRALRATWCRRAGPEGRIPGESRRSRRLRRRRPDMSSQAGDPTASGRRRPPMVTAAGVYSSTAASIQALAGSFLVAESGGPRADRLGRQASTSSGRAEASVCSAWCSARSRSWRASGASAVRGRLGLHHRHRGVLCSWRVRSWLSGSAASARRSGPRVRHLGLVIEASGVPAGHGG